MNSEENTSSSVKGRFGGFKLLKSTGGDSRLLWTVVALLIILFVDRLISPNFFDLRLVNDRLVGSLINILDNF